MATSQRCLLDEARIRFPGRSDVECIERVAAEIIDELAEEPPISLEVVASFRDIATVRVEPLPFAGSLTPEPSGLVMRLNAHDNRRRRRFSGFHEVGHTFQRGYLQQTLFRCATRVPGPPNSADPEDLADIAAAELLFPVRHFRRDLAALPFGWEGVTTLADTYDGSIYATALRTVRLASRPTMLVILEPGLRKAEKGCSDATPKLRVVRAHHNASFPFIPPNKAAHPEGRLDRALQGECIDEMGSLADLGIRDQRELRMSAQLFPYIDNDGVRRDRVLALYQSPAESRV